MPKKTTSKKVEEEEVTTADTTTEETTVKSTKKAKESPFAPQGNTYRGMKIVGEPEQVIHNGHPYTKFITESGESYMLSQEEFEAGLK